MHSLPDSQPSYSSTITAHAGELGARQEFIALLDAQLSHCVTGKNHLAVILADIRQFYQINIALGYEAGDRVLLEIEQRLEVVVQNHSAKQAINRHNIVRRLGDNVYGIVISHLQAPAFVQLAAEKISAAIAEPMHIDGERITLDASLGIAIASEFPAKAVDCLLNAERSLREYSNRPSGRGMLPIITEAPKYEQWQIEKQLKESLESNSLDYYYQPKIDLHSHKIVGAEALVRWDSEVLGLVKPDEFIPVAEKSDLINRITDLGIQACIRERQSFGLPAGDFSIAINITPSDIYSKKLPINLASALKIWGAKPQDVTLEVTESLIMEDPESCLQRLHELKQTGVRISIDDFGTGYSSLAYFKSIPADELKIDKSFVENVCHCTADADIAQLIIQLGHKFNLKIVAEGIEDFDTLQWLQRNGCDYAQGYYFSPPLPKAEFIDWIANFNANDYWR